MTPGFIGAVASARRRLPPSTWATAFAGAQAGTQLAKILHFQDSYGEGEGASDWTQRWIHKLVAAERTRGGIGGTSRGLVPAGGYKTYLSDSSSWRTPFTGAVTAPSFFGTQGDKGAQIAAGATGITGTFTGTEADIVYMQTGTGGGGGTLKVFIDGSGTAAVTINTASGAYAPGTIQRVSLGAAGSHTIKITATTSPIIVDGVNPYNADGTAGITYWDCSHTGYDNGNFQDGSLDYQIPWNTFAPDVVFDDENGGNEYLNATLTPTQMATRITTRITKYKSLTKVPTRLHMVNWVAPAMGAAGANGLGYTYAQYCTASINAINAAGGSGYAILDLRSVYPTAASNSSWFASDGLHPSDLGHTQIANAVEAVLATL